VCGRGSAVLPLSSELAHIRQPGPEFGSGFQVKHLKILNVVRFRSAIRPVNFGLRFILFACPTREKNATKTKRKARQGFPESEKLDRDFLNNPEVNNPQPQAMP